jgi:hypothetical protein
MSNGELDRFGSRTRRAGAGWTGGTPKRMTGASKGFQKAMQKANVVEDTAEELIK